MSNEKGKTLEVMPWERQQGEGEQAYQAFCVFRDLGEKRTMPATVNKVGKYQSLLNEWKRKWNWEERARAYDNDLQRAKYEKERKEFERLRKDHLTIATQLQLKALKAYQNVNPNDLNPRDIKEILKLALAIEDKLVLDNSESNGTAQGTGLEPGGAVENTTPIYIPENGRDEVQRGNMLAPQAGPQTMFMASKADIVIYGGAAGGGKTYALLLEGLRHRDVDRFGGVIFRHVFNQITAEGGLWDASHKMYDQVPGAVPHKTPKLHWTFNGKARINFAHINNDDDLRSWQGTEICYLGFDELTHFSKTQFLYMLSRNRSTCGVKPYVRATCNPDADSWVAEFISWWIDKDTGYPIPQRSGQIRYMCVLNNTIYMADTAQELAEEHDVNIEDCKTVTFISSRLEDNKILMETDPGYMANLKAMLEVERERLLMGNWKIKAAAGEYFRREQLGGYLEVIPDDVTEWVRCWDLAATEKTDKGDPAYTAGVLMGKRKNGRYIVADVINKQMSASDVRQTIKLTAQQDKAKFRRVKIRLPQDPGQAGKEQAQSYIKFLSGYNVVTVPESGSKEARAEPMAAQWQAGNFDLLAAPWNEAYLLQLENFPQGKFKDMVDASANGFAEIESKNTFNLRNLV